MESIGLQKSEMAALRSNKDSPGGDQSNHSPPSPGMAEFTGEPEIWNSRGQHITLQ
jgi:hypothetical protein